MAISNHTIISKMLRELQPLQEKTPSQKELQKSIENVKLMCELLLESTGDEMETGRAVSRSQQSVLDEKMIRMLQQSSEMTPEEYNVMMKGNATLDKPEPMAKTKGQHKSSSTDHGGANGESIFDF